jgi:hypothetical protein
MASHETGQRSEGVDGSRCRAIISCMVHTVAISDLRVRQGEHKHPHQGPLDYQAVSGVVVRVVPRHTPQYVAQVVTPLQPMLRRQKVEAVHEPFPQSCPGHADASDELHGDGVELLWS